uniref:Uncharacterized protein n=1 Tax=Mycobacterium riyadhense TaxID=486698 RepID=A0A653F484_9MYCO|nr:hypothetical protein BIN_B_05260 [Mycobacterium riyadhense]
MSHKASAESIPPGYRHAIPTTATGSSKRTAVGAADIEPLPTVPSTCVRRYLAIAAAFG